VSDPLPLSPHDKITVLLWGRSFRLSRFTYMLILGLLIGAITGTVAVLFRLAALYGERLFLPQEAQSTGSHAWMLLRRVAMPALGGLIGGVLLYRLGKFTGSHSIPAILRAVASGQIMLKLRMAVPPAVSIITMASGNSVGAEGPIAEIGSVLGSWMGRVVHAPPRMIKTLIGAGVAAGIAAVFNAPVGGVFFAVEVILRNYEVSTFTPIVTAAVVAAVISQVALGDHAAIMLPHLNQIPMNELPWFAVLGGACGLVSIAYILLLSLTQRQFKKLTACPQWLRPALGGLGVGLIGLGFPQVMGEGYGAVRQVLGEPQLLFVLCGLLVLKQLATCLSLGSGNPGGTFAPAVFQGAVLGMIFGQVLARFHLAQSAAPYAVVGMGGMIAAALGAPLTGIMIILRTSSADSAVLLLPLLCTVSLSLFVMQRWRGGSVYTHELLRGGIDLDRESRDSTLAQVTVSSILQNDGLTTLPAGLRVTKALERFSTAAGRWFVIVDEQGDFKGIIGLHDLRMAIADADLGALLVIGDLLEPIARRVTPEMNLLQVMNAFRTAETDVLPVFTALEASGRFAGVVTRQRVMETYLERVHGGEES
jgi:CIC family chloride channel protein